MGFMKIDNIQKNVLATLAIEGLKPSNKAIEINLKFLKGNITSQEAIKKIKEVYGC